MKKWISILLTLSMVLSLTACGNQDSTNATLDAENSQIEVDKELFDIIIKIPSDMIGEMSQEDLNAQVSEGTFHSATLNEDGSITYEMSKRQHKKLMDEMDAEINSSLEEMINSDDYPSFIDIKADHSYTHFTVTTTASELGINESFSVLGFYMIGGIHAVFNGDSNADITVDFINADSGKLISSSNSSEMGK